jgi:hypothetical protein
MKRIIVLLAIAAAVPTAAEEPAKEPTAAEKLASLTWLRGAWRGEAWGGVFLTQYTGPEGGMVLSTSKLIVDGRVRLFEFERFEVKGTAVVYTPYPGGNPAATFKLTALDAAAKKATFENPDKDFPTRVVFHRVADDNLLIVLDDPHGKSGKSARFDLKAVK